MSIFLKVLVYFLVFIFKFDLIEKNKQALKVKDALKEKILHHIAVVYTDMSMWYNIVLLFTFVLLMLWYS